jgi:hypothetical protein
MLNFGLKKAMRKGRTILENEQKRLFEVWAKNKPMIFMDTDFELDADGEYDSFITRLAYEAFTAGQDACQDHKQD